MLIPRQMHEKNEIHTDFIRDRFVAGDLVLRASILDQRAQYEEQLNTVNRSFSLHTPKLFLLLSTIGLAVSGLFEQFRQ